MKARCIPSFFRHPEAYCHLLESNGFRVLEIQHFKRPTRLPDGLIAWVHTFATSVINALPAADVDPFLQEVEVLARPDLLDDEGWWADYVRLRFIAVKPD